MNQPLNFIFIIMDDLTWGDLNVHGNPYTQTPVLNQLHKRSTRLNYYRSGSLCTPARSAIMTGRYPYRTRAFDTYCGRSMIDPDEQTIASYLRDGGYATCLSGKWHLGDNYPNRPSEMGFDQYLMHTGGGLCQPANYGNNDYFDPELLQDGQYVKTKGYCTDIFTNYAMDFIEAKQDQPFFIYLATNAPHSPIIYGKEWYKPFVEQGLNEELAKLYGMVENIDYNIGRILNYLEHLQLHENTMVIFTSDHGHCPSATFDGKARYNGGLRGGKGTPYEGGTRVPCFWYLPGVLAEDRSIEKETGTIDVFPTLQSFAGLNFPTKNKIDGADLKELMVMGKSNTFLDSRPIMLQWHRGDIPIPYRNFHVVKEGYKLCKLEETDDFELFYIPDDPGEQNNLATQQPKKVKELKEIYDCWLEDVSKTRPDNFAPPPIVAGTKFQKKVILNRNDWRIDDGQDGWGHESKAHWEVLFESAGSFTFEIEFKDVPPEATNVRLKVDFQDGSPIVIKMPRTSEEECFSQKFILDLPNKRANIEANISLPEDAMHQAMFVLISKT